ncbi:HAD family hydrolase [Acinetobacter sp. 187]|uniref:HAD family hydrolase n=1 Tax=Acinetobacter lanii TaxID=2715163 RepID=UPI00140A22FA|nr:HAD family hydrolase [Acinetobacter lanii]NHC04651.1 HAD family hydrolase [Acinetobacter lanii]
MQAVFFDLDNTLTHRDQSVQAYSRHLLQSFDTALNSNDERQYQKTLEIIRRIDNGGYPKKQLLTHPSIAGSVANALIEELDWATTPELEELTEFWFAQFGLSAVAMPGAEDLLQQLKNTGYRLAVISNGGHATRLKILQGLGFTPYFDAIFSSESVGIAKPNAEIFLHSCQQLGVEPQQSLYIGDHPVNDYQGAIQAGLNALLLSGFHNTDTLYQGAEIKMIHALDEVWKHL